MRMRTGYSVESQVTGNDTVGGLQFEITRLYRSPKGNDGSRPKEARFTIKLVSNNTELFFKVSHRTRVDELMCWAQKMSNSREYSLMEKGGFQLLFDGIRLIGDSVCFMMTQ